MAISVWNEPSVIEMLIRLLTTHPFIQSFIQLATPVNCLLWIRCSPGASVTGNEPSIFLRKQSHHEKVLKFGSKTRVFLF